MKYTEQAVETLDDAGGVIANKNIEIEQLRQRVQELEKELSVESGGEELVSKKIYVEDGLLLSKFVSEKFAEALIESYKSELLKEVGEPVGYHYLPNNEMFPVEEVSRSNLKNNPQDYVFLYTSDQLAAAQGENERLRLALDCTKRGLIRMRCPDFFEGVKDGYENLFDGHLVSMIGLINDYAKQK